MSVKNWIEEGQRRNARWLIISWDALERDWTRHYSSEEAPAPYSCGLESEQYRVDLTLDPAIAGKHVYLDEEP